jgi:hypothetical protein
MANTGPIHNVPISKGSGGIALKRRHYSHTSRQGSHCLIERIFKMIEPQSIPVNQRKIRNAQWNGNAKNPSWPISSH